MTTCETKNRPRNFIPRFDVWEAEDEVLLYGDVPGVAPEDLDIHYEDQELVIRGKVQPRHVDGRLLHQEFRVGDFERRFGVGEAIEVDKIEADLNQGVLTLKLPKTAAVKPTRIQVNS